MRLLVHRRAALLGLLVLFVTPCARAQQPPAALEDPRVTEFKQLAAQVVERRRVGAEESEELQEKTLKQLDALVIEQLNGAAPLDLAATNQRLAAILVRPGAVGESYELVRLSERPGAGASYALVVNFSWSGPSAIRYYTPSAQGFRFAARIDHWEFPDYFDEYAELVPIPAVGEILFLTVNGRTDEQLTGTFTAWRYSDGHFSAIWSTDILEHSSYENRPDGFHLSYCSQADEQKPYVCKRIKRERYQWDGFTWRLVEKLESDAPKPAARPAPPKRKPENPMVGPAPNSPPPRIDLLLRTVKT